MFRKKIKNFSRIFEREHEKRIYQKIRINDKIFNFFCIQEKRHISFMSRLSKIKSHYD